jgi:competence protein ComEA
MSTPNTQPPPEAPSRRSQAVLWAFVALLVVLLAVRGYGPRLNARPTDRARVAHGMDLNSADVSQLEQVPGLGPKTARAIAEHRDAHGPFASVENLLDVRGVGPVTFEKVRDQLRAGDAPPPPAPARQQPAPQPSATGVRKLQPGDAPINVNTATADDLMRLPGVGPVTAQAIVSARTTSPFRTVDDLDRVRGIGPKTLDKLRPFVVVN